MNTIYIYILIFDNSKFPGYNRDAREKIVNFLAIIVTIRSWENSNFPGYNRDHQRVRTFPGYNRDARENILDVALKIFSLMEELFQHS